MTKKLNAYLSLLENLIHVLPSCRQPIPVALAIRTTVGLITPLIGTTVVRITPLIGTTVVRIASAIILIMVQALNRN